MLHSDSTQSLCSVFAPLLASKSRIGRAEPAERKHVAQLVADCITPEMNRKGDTTGTWQKMRWLVVLYGALTCATVDSNAWGQSAHRGSRHVAATHSTGSEGAIKNVFWQPNVIKQGSPVFITVEFEAPATRVSGTWVGKTLTFFKVDNPKVWYALAGNDLETQPGTFSMDLVAALAGGRIARLKKPVEIVSAYFKSGAIDVPENFIEPDAASRRQIASDEIAKARAYAHGDLKPLWSGDFLKPVEGVATQTFGESRILNEEKSSTHRGTDYPVVSGTVVKASNAGVVVVAKEMFHEGNCVIIDHGGRFFTIYMHLSKIDVAVGDKLVRGAKLGTSGATGRVTGPHMHYGVRWNGSYLNPVQLLALTLPKIEPTSAAPGSPRSPLRQ